MDMINHWTEIKALFNESFSTSFHFAVATVNSQGEANVTPVGSILLGEPGKGIYFEKMTKGLAKSFEDNQQICVLAVNSSSWYWLKSLFGGRFNTPTAVRLFGNTGELRPATELEIARLQKRVSKQGVNQTQVISWLKTHMVRDIHFTRLEPVQMGGLNIDARDEFSELSQGY